MDLSQPGAAFVRGHEGFVARWYLDPVEVGTIGIGFTWVSDSFRVWWAANKPGVKFGPGATMTRDEAEDALIFLFRNEYGKAVNVFLKRDVPQHVFDGMASPVYNLGAGSLKWQWAGSCQERRLSGRGVCAPGDGHDRQGQEAGRPGPASPRRSGPARARSLYRRPAFACRCARRCGPDARRTWQGGGGADPRPCRSRPLRRRSGRCLRPWH